MRQKLRAKKGYLLREILAKEKCSLRELARMTARDLKGLRRVANGQCFPSWSTAVAIADVLGVPLDEFVRRRVRPLPEGGEGRNGRKGGGS